ncbi:MAG: hypothetical protein ACYCTF_10830 [Acidiferrobacter sp.]
MKGKYRTAISTLGVASVVAAALALLPAHPGSGQAPTVAGPLAGAPFPQVRVYRTPNGGLIRTETIRWQGPNSMTIVTWSGNAQAGGAAPPWVGAELQAMAAEQRLLATAMQQIMTGRALPGPLMTPWGALPGPQVGVEWPKTVAPAPHQAPTRPLQAQAAHPTVDL